MDQATLYETAYSFYQAGQYGQASTLFTQLVLQTPFEEKYWRGLAASAQMAGSYDQALHAWALTSLLATQDPYPHVHAAECYLSLNNKEEAMKALDAASTCLCSTPNQEEVKQKIELLRRPYGNAD